MLLADIRAFVTADLHDKAKQWVVEVVQLSTDHPSLFG
jgi:hypothetical protein